MNGQPTRDRNEVTLTVRRKEVIDRHHCVCTFGAPCNILTPFESQVRTTEGFPVMKSLPVGGEGYVRDNFKIFNRPGRLGTMWLL